MKTLVVIGGGASGVFCAVNAARLSPGMRVILLEKTSRLLSKVRISGGGRCNVTHACSGIAEMSKAYPRGSQFLKKTLGKFFATDTVEWFRERGVELKTEDDGRMFPVTDSSETIIDCLVNELNKYKVDLRFQSDVKHLRPTASGFTVVLSDRLEIEADYVCLATGGYPKASMFDWLGNLNHGFASPVPSLFTFNSKDNPLTQLMGVSVGNASAKIAGSNFSESGPVLITHWGLSGPAILRLSAWGARFLQERDYDFTVVINWVAPLHEEQARETLIKLRFAQAAQKLANRNPFALPSRLWVFLIEQTGISAEIRWSDLPAVAQNKLAKNLCSFECKVRGKTTYKDEFVTAGGINLSEIDTQTMQSRLVPGLFFAGEVMDADGITGGFNFQHAWSSGWIVADTICRMNGG